MQHQQTIPLAEAYVPTRDLAISAVASDVDFVTELIADVTLRLRTQPAWPADVAPESNETLAIFSPETSRVVVVLFQHLWEHDEHTQRDVSLLRQRMSESPDSVCVLALDATPLPTWLGSASKYEITRAGRAGAADFVVDAVVAAGGSVRPKNAPILDGEVGARWPEPPAPFLTQQRAHAALRHQLDALGEALETVIESSQATQSDRLFELQILPNRLVARLDDVAVSFSWVVGASSTVADGRLMAIAWRNVAGNLRGLAALKSAEMFHECSYLADGDSPDGWRWRAEDRAGQAYSSANLVAAWIARVSIARTE